MTNTVYSVLWELPKEFLSGGTIRVPPQALLWASELAAAIVAIVSVSRGKAVQGTEHLSLNLLLGCA